MEIKLLISSFDLYLTSDNLTYSNIHVDQIKIPTSREFQNELIEPSNSRIANDATK